MKKILCVLLAAAMMLSFTGCNIGSLVSSIVESSAAADNETVENDEPTAKFDAGSINGNVYSNDYLGLTFTAPEGWTYASDEEIAELMGTSLDIVTDDESAQELAAQATIYGMMANSADELNNVQVVFENMALSGGKMTAAGYIKILSAQLDSLYGNMGGTCTVGEAKTIQIGGKDYSYVDIAVDISGVALEQSYACHRIDDYMVSIIVTAYEEGGAAAIMDCFE